MAAGTAIGAPGDDSTPPEREDEYERLFAFREERFKSLGFNEWQSASLATEHVDWHDAARLIDAGCPLDVAIDILL